MQMMRVGMVALRSDRKPLLEALQWMGVLDIESAAASEETLPEGFTRPDTRSQTASFERAAAVARDPQRSRAGVQGPARRPIGAAGDYGGRF